MQHAEPTRNPRRAAAQPASISSTAQTTTVSEQRPRFAAQPAAAETLHDSPRVVAQRRQLQALVGPAQPQQTVAPPGTLVTQRIWEGELAGFHVDNEEELARLEALLKVGHNYLAQTKREELKQLAIAEERYATVAALAVALKLKPKVAAKLKIPDLPVDVEVADETVYSNCVEKGRRLVGALNAKLAAPPLADGGKTTEEFDALYSTRKVADGPGRTDMRSDRTASTYEKQYHNKVSDTATGKRLEAETNRKITTSWTPSAPAPAAQPCRIPKSFSTISTRPWTAMPMR